MSAVTHSGEPIVEQFTPAHRALGNREGIASFTTTTNGSTQTDSSMPVDEIT